MMEMQSNWYNEELQKAILGYRGTIAALEHIKKNVNHCDRDDFWLKQAEARILQLKKSIASLENFRGDQA